MKAKSEFQKFDETMDAILRVSHSEIKAKLEAERVAKRKKRKPMTSASRASGAKPTSD